METKRNTNAREIASALTDTATLAEGALQLLDDAIWRHPGDARHDAFRVLLAKIAAEAADAADSLEELAVTLQ